MSNPLVSTQWLEARLSLPDLFIFDASVDKVVGKDAIVYPQFVCLPKAYSLNIDRVLSKPNTAAPHVFPESQQLQALAEKIGFNQSSTLVIYDNQGIYSAPRAWWIFKSFGFEQVYVLDGGLPKWLDENRPTVNAHNDNNNHNKNDSGQQASLNQVLQLKPGALTAAEDILLNIESPSFLLVDVRSSARFSGQAAEPRPGIRRGHISKSINLPFAEVLDKTQYKTGAALEASFSHLPTDKSQPLVFSCGSGMTACIVLLAAAVLGFQSLSLYDGSWSEWGADDRLPIEW